MSELSEKDTSKNTTPKLGSENQDELGAKQDSSARPNDNSNVGQKWWIPLALQPYLIGNTILTIAVLVGVLGVLLSTGISNQMQLLSSGDPIALILVLSVCTGFLCATMSLLLLNLINRETKRDSVIERKDAEFTQLGRYLHKGMNESLQMHDETNDKINQFVLNSGNVYYRRPNDSGAWTGLAADTSFISIGGRCSSEVTFTKMADSSPALEVNLKRLEAWLPRLTAGTALSEIKHIVTDDGVSEGTGSIVKLLACYRSVQAMLVERTGTSNLSRVKIVVVEKERLPSDSIFLGVRKAARFGNKDAAFVMKYCAIPLPTAVALNNDLDVSYSPELVGQFLGVSNELIEGAVRVLNLSEAEALYGSSVPTIINATTNPISIETPRRNRSSFDGGDGSFYLGDHFE